MDAQWCRKAERQASQQGESEPSYQLVVPGPCGGVIQGLDGVLVSSVLYPVDSHSSPLRTVASVLPLKSFEMKFTSPGPLKEGKQFTRCNQLKCGSGLWQWSMSVAVVWGSDEG